MTLNVRVHFRAGKVALCEQATLGDVKKIIESVPSQHIFIEPKYDGVRATCIDGKFYDRRGKEITHLFPEFSHGEKLKGYVFDGEIIGDTFEDVAGRVHLKDKFKIQLSSKKSPATYVAFDMLMKAERNMSNLGLGSRRELLEKCEVDMLFPWFQIAERIPLSDFDERYKWAQENKDEGFVVKLDSFYQFKRTSSWLKLKLFQEVSHIFTKYDEHPRGVRLEDDEGRSVNVNGIQAVEVKKQIDENGKVEVEVQFLPQKNSDAWRFPSFKRIVGDA